ncbi:protein NPAT-like [Mytilus trossulus]|uniref:protein NPAT-like n=1 Tax=Mytilus trossulus TaxID=6551 RepID=UPI0030051F90
MDTTTSHFLPSEIARLVLGFLESEGYTSTYKTFMKECIHLQEYVALMKRGRHYPLTISGFTLIQIIEKFAQFYLVDVNNQKVGLNALWNQLDSVTACLKRATLNKNLRVEGCSQTSRTRRANVIAKYGVNEKGDSGQTAGVSASDLKISSQRSQKIIQNRTIVPVECSNERIPVPISTLLVPKESLSNTNESQNEKLLSEVQSQEKHSSNNRTQILILKSPSKTVKPSHTSLHANSPSAISSTYSINEILPTNNSTSITSSSIEGDTVSSIGGDQIVHKSSEIVSTIINTIQTNRVPSENDNLSSHVGDDNGAGFHDDMECDTQLSPLPQSVRENVIIDKDTSREVIQNSVCDRPSKENLVPDETVNLANHSVCSEGSKENLTTNDSIIKANQIALNVNDTEILIVCDKSSGENLTLACENLFTSGITIPVCDKLNRVGLLTERMNTDVPSSPLQTENNRDISVTSSKPNETVRENKMDNVLFRNDPVQETTEDIAVIQLPDVQTENADSVVPVTPRKVVPPNDLPIMKTPGKKIREYGLQGQGKSPRRKRPPKRKSHGDKITERRSSLPHLNDSSNSNDGSLHDSFPTQFLEQLLNNPLLHEKLAENINKTINCSDLSKSQNLSDVILIHDTSQKSGAGTPKPSTSLEDILDPHETQMTGDQINDVIDMTKGDAVFDSLFKLFHEDSRAGSYSSDNRLDEVHSMVSGVSPLLPVTTANYLSCDNTTINSAFKPINSAECDFTPSFPIVTTKTRFEKSFENKYVSEDSINAVLQSYSSVHTRTLNTPTDFSVISNMTSSSVHTSTSSCITPTVTISTASRLELTSQSTSVTSTSRSVVCLQSSSSTMLNQESIDPEVVSQSGSSKCLTSSVSLTSDQNLVSSASNYPLPSASIICSPSNNTGLTSNNISSAISTPSNQSIPVTTGSNPVSKSTSYITFVKGVAATENSSTPVGQRASPLTVQMEDTTETFKGLPSDVKQLFSSFEENLSELSKSQEEANEKQTNGNTRSLRKNKKVSPKTPSNRNKISPKSQKKSSKSKNKKECQQIEDSASVHNVESYLGLPPQQVVQSDSNKTKKSPKNSKKTSPSSKNAIEIPVKKNSKNSTAKSKDTRSPIAGKPKEKKLTPRPQIRCDPLKPKNDNKGTKSSPLITTSASKWSSDLSALIKIASPEKERKDCVQEKTNEISSGITQTPTGRKKAGKSQQTPIRTPSEKSGKSSRKTPLSNLKKSDAKQTSQSEPQTFLCSISPTSKDFRHVPLKNTSTIEEKTPSGIIKLGPSCLGRVLKMNTHFSECTNTVIIPDNVPTISKNLAPYGKSSKIRMNKRTISPLPIAPILSMPTLDGNSNDNFMLNDPIVLTPTVQRVTEHVADENEMGQILKASTDVMHARTPPSKFDNIIYTPNSDYLESPVKQVSGDRMNIIQHTTTPNLNGIPNSPPVQAIYTATPISDFVGTQNVHIRPLDFDAKSYSSPLTVNNGKQKQRKQKQNVTQSKRGKKPAKSAMVMKQIIPDVIAIDSGNETENDARIYPTRDILTPKIKSSKRTADEPMGPSSVVNFSAISSVNIVTKDTSIYRPISETKSVNFSAISGLNIGQKDISIYRPLSETESEDGNSAGFQRKQQENVTIVQGDKVNNFISTDDDLIPDACGNVHMNNGQVMNVRPHSTDIIIQIPLKDGQNQNSSQNHNVKPVQTKSRNSSQSFAVKPIQTESQASVQSQIPIQGHLHNEFPIRARTPIDQLASDYQGFNVSPSCQKFIGQFGLNPKNDKFSGKPLNTHINLKNSVDRKTTSSSKASSPGKLRNIMPKPSVGTGNIDGSPLMPVFYDIHLTKDSSNDTCSSEVEQINTMAKRADMDMMNKSGCKTKAVETLVKAQYSDNELSTGSSDIDVEAEWENPWKNISGDVSDNTLVNSPNVTVYEKSTSVDESSPKKTISNKDPVSSQITSKPTTFKLHRQSETIYSSSNTPVTGKYIMTPPKKRITASMKCGSGLYFVSTNEQKNTEASEKVSKTKRTPKKTLSEFTNLRRSPRLSSTAQSCGKSPQLVDKVKRNLTDIQEDGNCDRIKSGNKRPREESDDNIMGTESRPKSRKLKTPVDLKKLNVDKFLTKLYKS